MVEPSKTNMFVLQKQWLEKPEAIPALLAQVVENITNNAILPYLGKGAEYKCKAFVIGTEDMQRLAQDSLSTSGNYGPFIGANVCLVVELNDFKVGTLGKLERSESTTED